MAATTAAQEPRVEVPRYNSISDSYEVALGQAFAAALEKEQKLPFVDTPSVRRYVIGVVTRLARASRRPGLSYSVKIVDTADTNAFALPGGFIYVDRGLLEWVRSESELAAVLSHELGHVAGRHASNRIARSAASNALLRELSEAVSGSDTAARALAGVGRPLTFLAEQKFRRSNELQADLLGYYTMQRAGWNPDGMVAFLRRVGSPSGPREFFRSFIATHPSPRERERRILEEMRKFPPAGRLVIDSAPFRIMQARLRARARDTT